MTSEWLTLLTSLLTVLGGMVASVWYMAWFLSRQLSEMKSLFYSQIDILKKAILDKIEYHEQHDDKRFSQITDELWAIKVRNASADDYNRRIFTQLKIDKLKEEDS